MIYERKEQKGKNTCHGCDSSCVIDLSTERLMTISSLALGRGAQVVPRVSRLRCVM